MVNILKKKLQPMGNTAYFLMHPEDVAMYNLNVGDFYKINIKEIGDVTLMLKLYGTSRVFQVRKQIFDEFPKLKKNTIYTLELVGLTVKSTDDLDKNPSKYRTLSTKIDKLATRVSVLEKKEK